MKAARVDVLIHRDDVLQAYRAGAPMLNLCSTWQVDPRWLTAQFDTWDEPLRDRSATAIARDPGTPPRPARS
ncbi:MULTISPECIES: hypothetical protein [unclassified Streptomyces]|uniref:hypothetical protein n=1 Tax=unclassified Streptomyces TaxID=2593676 RepID=UPI000939DD82|nr:hypothetical protein [Streptomyces sp. TSRI0281]OKI34901.1 hypothetical protein A6A29_15810 [Streptomyces sp. TSRI0281]